MTLFVSDVHGAVSALRQLVSIGSRIVVLGDLANLTDYRSGEGAVADVLGIEFARSSARARADGDFRAMRTLWLDHVGDGVEEVRDEIARAIERQYAEVKAALTGGQGLVIHGNVDRPGLLQEFLPEGFRYVHGEAVEVEGLRLGFVGGGLSTPLGTEGEVSDAEMADMLESLGPVDVLCTHVPPAVSPLRRDVITGREERGSQPILDYIVNTCPRYHLFGDVHQPQATTWRIGPTRCMNAGYFRATGRYLRLEDGVLSVGRIG